MLRRKVLIRVHIYDLNSLYARIRSPRDHINYVKKCRIYFFPSSFSKKLYISASRAMRSSVVLLPLCPALCMVRR